MQRLFTAITLFLTSFWVCAAVREADEGVASAPVEMVDTIYVVLFVILFFGSIIWFFIHMWRNERKNKQDQ